MNSNFENYKKGATIIASSATPSLDSGVYARNNTQNLNNIAH